MGTAIVCFVFAGLCLLPLVGIARVEGDATTKMMAAMPFIGVATIWFLAGMHFLWLQRLHDAIASRGAAIARLLEEIKEHGLDVRATNRKPTAPTQAQQRPQQNQDTDAEMPWMKGN